MKFIYITLSVLILATIFFGFNAVKIENNPGAVNTAGTLSFTVKTATAGGQYAPRNVFAIWITDAAGTFIKSLKVMASERKTYLYQWKTVSKGSVIDATTGATLSSHQNIRFHGIAKIPAGLMFLMGIIKSLSSLPKKTDKGLTQVIPLQKEQRR